MMNVYGKLIQWRTTVIEWWRGIFLVDISWQNRWAWLWKFLISWSDGVTIGFYPDYEHCRWEIALWTGKERR